MEVCINEIRDWLKCNHLKLNDQKTEVIILGKDHLRSEIEGNIFIQIGGEYIKPQICVKNLGVFIDRDMCMQEQVKNVCRSCYASIFSIGRIRKFLDEENVKILVHAFVTCKLDSLNALLFGVSDKSRSLGKLQMILNTSARLIFKLKKYDRISNVLMGLHWLPVEARIDYKILLLTFKALNGQGPQYLVDLLHFKQYRRSTRASSDHLTLEIPQTRLPSLGDRSFSFTSATLWNSLPFDIRASQSVSAFKSNLKTFLFKRSYPNCE